jgi:hypothetical protein
MLWALKLLTDIRIINHTCTVPYIELLPSITFLEAFLQVQPRWNTETILVIADVGRYAVIQIARVGNAVAKLEAGALRTGFFT